MRPKIIFKRANNHIEIVNDNLDYYLNSKKQIEKAMGQARKGVADFVDVEILEKKVKQRVKIGPGRPG